MTIVSPAAPAANPPRKGASKSTHSSDKYAIMVRIEPDRREIHLPGREAWAMRQLVRAGTGGCTPITHPGPRWSDYVFKLRRNGFVLETVHEAHAGPFPGTHARYVLHTAVTSLEDTRVAA